ncbi:hypothetical protein NOC27_1412 [Nitrosococcus oceani AFC27]|nr:hypothetical protein NOC27_1412 [Nitrosococcus oceani AFC27]
MAEINFKFSIIAMIIRLFCNFPYFTVRKLVIPLIAKLGESEV